MRMSQQLDVRPPSARVVPSEEEEIIVHIEQPAQVAEEGKQSEGPQIVVENADEI
jgi:hypothetical protein